MNTPSTLVRAALLIVLSAACGPVGVPGANAASPAVPVDLLSIAHGALVVSATVGGKPSASDAVRVIDGSSARVVLAKDSTSPAVFVYELPAPTTFDRFEVPAVVEAAGNATFFRHLTIAGSSRSASEGFEVLFDGDIEGDPTSNHDATLLPTARPAVRWVRVTLAGGQRIEHPPGMTNLEFTELVGIGTQAEVPLSTAFTGVWDLRFSDAPDRHVEWLELKQTGATVSGCLGEAELEGTVNGSVARIRGIDRTRGNRPSAYLLGAASNGVLLGLESTNRGVFRARVAPTAPPGTSTPCSGDKPALPACDSTFYVNFDVNSAALRPDAKQVLDDVYQGLSGATGAVVLEGHTSTEGTADANLALSQRRAEAVVEALVARGLPRARLTARGKGETEPLLADADSESARMINRRVTIVCGAP